MSKAPRPRFVAAGRNDDLNPPVALATLAYLGRNGWTATLSDARLFDDRDAAVAVGIEALGALGVTIGDRLTVIALEVRKGLVLV